MTHFDLTFEWDEEKRRINRERHGIHFIDAIGMWEGPVLEVPSTQTHHGETRWLATGRCEGRFVTVVFTWRNEARRIISARTARKRERENYEDATG